MRLPGDKNVYKIMQRTLFILAIAGSIFFTSCGNNKKKEQTGTHTHEDGTVHHNDANEHDAVPDQESFEIKEETEGHEHHGQSDAKEGESHDSDGHDHDHEH